MKNLQTYPARFALAGALLLTAAFPLVAQGRRQPVAPLPPTADEIRVLTFMREEEKLARDVYRFLYDQWGISAFDRIAQSEQRHFDSIGALLARYQIADPAAATAPGVYANEAFTKMYAELTAKGSLSLKDALEVGVLIEKTDIDDLEKALPATAKFDIKQVFTNLMLGSFNHLEAFEFNLELLSVQ